MFSFSFCQLSLLQWRFKRKKERSWHRRRKKTDSRAKSNNKNKTKSMFKRQQWSECWKRKRCQQFQQSRTHRVKRRSWSEKKTTSLRNLMIKKWSRSLMRKRFHKQQTRKKQKRRNNYEWANWVANTTVQCQQVSKERNDFITTKEEHSELRCFDDSKVMKRYERCACV